MGQGESLSNYFEIKPNRNRQDSIVLTIVPPGVHSSPLLDLRHAVPIRLVTDPHSSEVGTVSSDWPVDDKSAMAY